MSDNKELQLKEKKVPEKTTHRKHNKFVGFFVAIGSFFKRKFSGMIAELKKVTWPTFPTSVKQTGVVIVVVLFFLVIVGAFDYLLSWLISWVSTLG